MKKKFDILTLVTMCLFCIAGTMVVLLLIFTNRFGGKEGLAEALKYTQIRRIISDSYIGESDPQAVSDAGYSAMIQSLGDPWSYYMTAEQYADYAMYSDNRYTGIGVTIQTDEATGGLLVTAVSADSPAEAAGIEAGDVLLSLDGESLVGLSTTEVRDRIRSRVDQKLLIGVLHPDGTQNEYEVDCRVLETIPVSFEMLEGNIGYIRIENFESGSGAAAVEAVEQLSQQGAAGLVFDVRNNPGGKVDELLEILDCLLPEGDLFVSRNRQGEETVETSDARCTELPMAVLVNGNSYSAAEFFAAALQEYDWAQVVGTQTTGKGRSQVTYVQPDGSAVHISIHVYLTPNRVDLSQQGGITPDILVESTGEGDLQLETARKACLDRG